MDSQNKTVPMPTPLTFTSNDNCEVEPVKMKHERKDTPIKDLVNELKMPERSTQPQQPATTRSEKYSVDPNLIGRCSEELENLQHTITNDLHEERHCYEQLKYLQL